MKENFAYITNIPIKEMSQYWPYIYPVLEELHPGIRWQSGKGIHRDINTWSSYSGDIFLYVGKGRRGYPVLTWGDGGQFQDDLDEGLSDDYEIRDLFDYLQLNNNNFFPPLNESEEWFDEVISNVPELPEYNGKNEYVIHFNSVPSKEYLNQIIETLGMLDWDVSNFESSSIESIIKYVRYSPETYIFLRLDGDIVYGPDLDIFYSVNGTKRYDRAIKIYI